MIQWPPSPIVEDEHSALAKEHSTEPSPVTAKSTDDHSVPSRGSIDQFPIILESNIKDVSETANSSTAPNTPPKPFKGLKVTIPMSGESGLLTPPPSDNEIRGRSRFNDLRNAKEDYQRVPRSKSCDPLSDTNKPVTRPPITRLHTDISGELENMKAGTRRAPSPYSYKSEDRSRRVDPTRLADTHFLSPACAFHSPISILSSTPQSQSHRPDRDSSTDSLRRPKKSIRFSDVLQGPGSAYGASRESSIPPTPNRHSDSQISQFEHVHTHGQTETRLSRAAKRDPLTDRNLDLERNVNRSTSRPSRSASNTREPHNESKIFTDDKVRDACENHHLDRPSIPAAVNRFAEKIRLTDLPNQNASHTKPDSPQNDNMKRNYHIRNGQYSVTPPSATTPKHMEDYFSQAFERNSQKSPRYTPRLSFDGTAAHSPTASPPRTPRTERSSKIYVASPSTSPRHSLRSSRLPSWDENQFIELKTPTSLLSKATAAATIAAKTSPPELRTPSTLDNKSNGLLPSPILKSRTRPPSPVREERSESTRRRYPSLPPSNRSNTRETSSRSEILSPSTFQPPNPVSCSSNDVRSRGREPQLTTSLHYKTGVPPPLPSPLGTAPPIIRPQPILNQALAVHRTFAPPKCSRPRPLLGLRDWNKIRGIHGLRICPTCARFVADTRYHKLLQQSHNDRDDQEIRCEMSNPWINIAFMQSLKQNTSDLRYVDEVWDMIGKHDTCSGPKRTESHHWYRVIDTAYNNLVPNFFVCSACVRTVDRLFPDVPNLFEKEPHRTERSCGLHSGGRDFTALVDSLDLLAKTCRERGVRGSEATNPFIGQVYQIIHRPICAREAFLSNRLWHFTDDVPEFTICGPCFEEVILPLANKPIARNICRTPRSVPRIALPGLPATGDGITHPVSCQLYSDKMRRYFTDAVDGMLSYEAFKMKARERFMMQWQLSQTSKRYEENQKTVENLKAELERSSRYWRMME